MAFLVLITMIFLHAIADYSLQGILATMKQQKWWHDNFPDQRLKYRNDYKVALCMHSFEWSFMIMLPAFVQMIFSDITFAMVAIYVVLIIDNTSFHMVVDDMKANEKKINLIEDQLLHLIQVVVTWLLWLVIFGW